MATSTFGVDNFIGELTVDGSTANFTFSDPDDTKNVESVSVSPKEFPEGVVSADSREVSDYAYSLVSEKMNAVRSDRIKATETKQLSDEQDKKKADAAVSAKYLSDAQDAVNVPNATEKRDDGIVQNVYNAPSDDTAARDQKDAKKK